MEPAADQPESVFFKKMKCVFLSFFGVIGASVPLCVRAGHKSIKLAFHNSVFLKD